VSRKVARELAFQTLFQVDLGRNQPSQALSYIISENHLSDKARSFLEDLVYGTCKFTKEIDALLAKFAHGWTIERMSSTDRNVLRMALYELVYREDVPVSVTVNEAVEIAKHFGDDESGKFVNGILGNIIRQFTLPDKPGESEVEVTMSNSWESESP
jgi:N utilization substance protein B